MRRLPIIIMVVLCITAASNQAACKKSGGEAGGVAAPSRTPTVQEPAVAGQFYPGSREELRRVVDSLLAAAPAKKPDGQLMGLVVPHAGYQYSGPIAAAGFRQLKGRTYKRVVVLALSHRVPVAGAALSTRDRYRTPLGEIPIDTEAVAALLRANTWAKDDPLAFEKEHSLEVELPFLQTTLKDFKLVPILVGTDNAAVLTKIAEALDAAFPGPDTLFVASTDLSHYHPYADAVARDRATVDLITGAKAQAYYQGVLSGKAELCGSAPVDVLKQIVERRGGKLELLQYANSGDTAGDRSRVVGYVAIAAMVPDRMSKNQKEELLKLARATLQAHVTGTRLPPLPRDPALKTPAAAFVTLREQGELRGCIGRILAEGPLDATVQQMTIEAASRDPRFPPVRPDELKKIDIEVSVLTPPEPLPDPLEVRVGTDGLIIEKGFHRGVLLPQVPTEQGWNREQFLEGIAQKAGLPPDGWRGARLERFQAIVFGEKEQMDEKRQP